MNARNYLRITWLVEAIKAVNVYLDNWQTLTSCTRSNREQLVIDDVCNEIRLDLDNLIEKAVLS